MLKLKIIQALNGDCLVLEHASQDGQFYMLVDGGPGTVYKKYLKKELLSIRDTGGKVNLAVLSHIDDDHVNGLLDLLNELIKQREKKKRETIAINGIWLNSFSKTLGTAAMRGMTRHADVSIRLGSMMPKADLRFRSIKQGNDFTSYAQELNIPINYDFRQTLDQLVCVDNFKKPNPQDKLKIWVIGPTKSALKSLRKEWRSWLTNQKRLAKLPVVMAKAKVLELDESVPNLSSIMLLVEADGKKVLLTGDGLGKHLMEGLHQVGLLKEDGVFHVDVFKLPHHGSMRNVTPELFEHITADIYVICADGTNGNPDFQTLEWLVKAALKQGRSFRFVATKETPSIKTLVEQYNPEKSFYTVEYLEPDARSFTLDLSEP
jgi:beta-lactamase superfamily II metal-dependent hydrolase